MRYRDLHVHLHDVPAFTESKHPRGQAGSSKGGQFVKKGTGTAAGAAKRVAAHPAVQHGAGVLKRSFGTHEHKHALNQLFGSPRAPGRSKWVHGLQMAAKAPGHVLKHILKNEAHEWKGAANGIRQILSGKKPDKHSLHALEAVAVKAVMMVGVGALAGSLPEFVGHHAISAVSHEFVTHTLAENLAKFGAAATQLFRRKGGDAMLSDEQLMATLLQWLAQGVQSADLTDYLASAA
jgi:hypothetical protein